MRNKLLKYFLLIIILIHGYAIYAQTDKPYVIANDQQSFVNNFMNTKSNQSLKINFAKEQFSFTSKVKRQTDKGLTLIGTVNGQKLSTFSFSQIDGKLEGTIVLSDAKKAYTIYAEVNGKVFAKETDINNILCIDFENSTKSEADTGTTFSKMALQLESLPGAPGIIYLDFDGELVSGTSWLGGATIDAQSPNFSNERIIAIWKIMAEDFRPFNFNVTTRRDLFDAAPVNRRMMCIFTPTKDARPDAGGVAFRNSFSSSTDNPCWVYNIRSTRAAGETGSHEVGHTLGLSHDGQGGTEYYNGHGQWSPIMGWSASTSIGQWSLGEYTNATNTQDDIAIIAGSRNGVGFKNDDHDDIIQEATPIIVTAGGEVDASQNFGLVSTREDKDMFSFVVETGNVSFTFNPDPDYPNLNIQARILNALGEEMAFSDPNGLSASINTNLEGGTYFIEIDGVGEGTPINGYSDYSSLGNYTISGNYIPGNNNQPPVANFEATKSGCSMVEFKSTSINKVSSYLWNFGDGTTSAEQNPTHEYETGGLFTVSLTTSNEVGENTNKKTDFVIIDIPDQPITNDQNICTGESATITVSGNSAFRWYDAPTGGNLISQGTVYETPALTSSQTYYIAGIIGDCTTETRTVVKALVAESLNQPTIQVNNEQKLSIDTAFTRYQWYFDGEVIDDTNAGQATYLPQQVGEYSIEVFNEAGCNIISEVFIVDQSQLNLSLSSRTFTYYPNPVEADKMLNIEGFTINDYNITIVDLLGQAVIQSNPIAEIDVSELSNGLYIILINNKPIGKFVKQ